MIPTPIGAIIILAGLWFLFRPAVEMLIFVLFCSLFAGASAIDAVALGHSSIPPNELALGFLAVRLCRRDFRRSPAIISGLRHNAWLVVFCTYAAASAFVLPRIFAGRVLVMSMQHAKVLAPLAPSSQNITQALYILGTAFGAVATSAVVVKDRAPDALVKGVLLISWTHIATGVADALASAVHINGIFDFLRNGAYAQLDQEVGTYHRISGITPEPSAYAGLGIVFLIMTAELWLRSVRVWWTGLTSLAMVAVLVASTSSTAYLFLASYGLILAIRALFFANGFGWTKVGLLLGVLGAGSAGGLALLLLKPALASGMLDVLESMTVKKGESLSGLERGMWARQGWQLFEATRGLGVGLGSFRSSNIFTAILGSIGPAALAVLLVYLMQVFKPARLSTYGASHATDAAVGDAAAWVPILILIPAAASGPSADPGLLFGVFAGCSLALRSFAYRKVRGEVSERLRSRAAPWGNGTLPHSGFREMRGQGVEDHPRRELRPASGVLDRLSRP